jgi:hypothetical protein
MLHPACIPSCDQSRSHDGSGALSGYCPIAPTRISAAGMLFRRDDIAFTRNLAALQRGRTAPRRGHMSRKLYVYSYSVHRIHLARIAHIYAAFLTGGPYPLLCTYPYFPPDPPDGFRIPVPVPAPVPAVVVLVGVFAPFRDGTAGIPEPIPRVARVNNHTNLAVPLHLRRPTRLHANPNTPRTPSRDPTRT